jgi:hypothetical protein
MRTSKVQAVATVIVVWPSPPVVVIGFGLAENRVTSQPGALGGTVSCWVLRVSTNRNPSIAREGGAIPWSNCDHASRCVLPFKRTRSCSSMARAMRASTDREALARVYEFAGELIEAKTERTIILRATRNATLHPA